MTLFILEYQAMDDGSCTMTPPLGYTDETSCLTAFFNKCASAVSSTCDTHTVIITNSEGNCYKGYWQVLKHKHD